MSFGLVNERCDDLHPCEVSYFCGADQHCEPLRGRGLALLARTPRMRRLFGIALRADARLAAQYLSASSWRIGLRDR